MGYYRKLLLLVILILFSGASFSQKHEEGIKDGVLDFSAWDFQRDGNLKLEGNWEFYWSKLYSPSDFSGNTITPDAFVAVPGVWTGTLVKGNAISNTGCATYRLTVMANGDNHLMLSFKEIISAYKVWLNGEVIVQAGVVANSSAHAKPAYQLNTVPVNFKKGPNEIIVQISNFNHRANAFEYAPVIGTIGNIEKEDFKGNAVDLIAMGLLLIMAFYHLGLFVFRPKDLPILTFSIFCFLALLRLMVTSNYLLGHFFTSSTWGFVYFLKYFTFYTIIPLLGLLIQQTFNEKRYKWIFNSLYIVSGIFVLTLFLPSLIYTKLLIFWEFVALGYYAVVLGGLLIRYALKKLEGAIILLLSVSLLAIATINDMLFFNDVLNTMEMVPIGIFILILGQALTLGKRFTSVYYKYEELAIMLESQNENLKSIVNERTRQLEEEKIILSQTSSKLQKYFTAIEQASATIVITDTQGNIEYANPQFEKTTGYSISEAIGKNPRILKSGKTPEHIYPELWKTIKSGKVWRGEFVNRKKTKEDYIEKVIISPVLDQNGIVVNFIAIKDDITEVKKTEQALALSEEKYRLIAENTCDLIGKIDISTMRFSYMSPSVETIYGYTVEEALTHTVEESFTLESYAKIVSFINHYLSIAETSGISLCERFQQPCKNGSIIDTEITAAFINGSDGKPVDILFVARDISERVKIENKLKVSEERLSKLLVKQSSKNKQLRRRLEYVYNKASNAIAFFDFVGDRVIVSSCNKLWANNYGLEPEDVEGRDIEIIGNDEVLLIANNIARKLKKRKKAIQEYFFLNNMHLQLFVFPIFDETSGDVVSCAVFAYNISEKVEAELKAHETEQRFFAIFSNSPDAIVLLSINLDIEEVNEGFFNLYGSREYSKTGILENLIPSKYQKEILKRVDRLRNGDSLSSFEFELIRYDGELIPVEMISSMITIDKEPMILSIIRDISIRKNMDKMLTLVGAQIENRERRTLASDLHDNVGPLLSSLNMYLSVLALKPGVQPYFDILNNIERILKEAITSVREISNNLSPQVLSAYGLTSALNLFFETKMNFIDVKIENSIGNFRFSEVKESMVYYIIKEAFNNSLKYSNATIIKLSIQFVNDQIEVIYSDDGIGFDLEEKLSEVSSSLGLFNIFNRVKLLNGDYSIETSPGNGFSLRIIFPTSS